MSESGHRTRTAGTRFGKTSGKPVPVQGLNHLDLVYLVKVEIAGKLSLIVDVPDSIAEGRDVWKLREGEFDEVEMFRDLEDDARAGVSSSEAVGM